MHLKQIVILIWWNICTYSELILILPETYGTTTKAIFLTLIIRFIPQGTVDNNLGPDRLAGPKALTSQLFQTTNPLIALPLYLRSLLA